VLTQQLPLHDGLFKTIDVNQAAHSLRSLLAQVSSGIGRIEIVDANGCVCVLLSKIELDTLERAISILSGTTQAQEMRDLLRAIAAAAIRSAEGSLHAV
jgi:PHD/YefM family antitoxin component YafN of YafNO toxin-antitoxin module